MATRPGYSSTRQISPFDSEALGLALRTCLVSELAALTGFSMSWRMEATPAGRSWWVLGAPAPHTGGTGCGSLLPTCRVSLGRTLPTPLAVEARGSLGQKGSRGQKRHLSSMMATHSRNSRPLSEQLQRDAPGTVGRRVFLAVVEWLMGYPPDWLAAASPPTATPSFRRLRKP